MSTSPIYLPILNSDDSIELTLDDLSPSEVESLFSQQLAHPEIWYHAAMKYFEAEQFDSFERLLRTFTDGDTEDQVYTPNQNEANHRRSERIRIFNTLAAFYTRKASMATKSSDQDRSFHEATDLLNRSADLDAKDTMTWVGKGVLQLLQGKLDDAQTAFNSALLSDKSKDNVLVRLGLGCIAIQKRAYKDALKHYKSALLANPALPGFVRLGFGICYYYLGDINLARDSFQRVLDMSPNEENVHALLGLATLSLNGWREKANQIEIDARKNAATSSAQALQVQATMKALENDSSIVQAFDYLQRAFNLDPTNIHALMLLSTHAFHTGDLKRSHEFATRAEQFCAQAATMLPNETRGLVAYHIARAEHAMGDHHRAMIKYEEAKGFIPQHPPTCLGYAQMLVSCRSETEQAIQVLESVLLLRHTSSTSHDAKAMAAAASNNFEVLRLLGSLYAMPPSPTAVMIRAAAGSGTSEKKKKEGHLTAHEAILLPNLDKAFTYLTKSVELHPNSLELLLEFAEVALRLHEYNHAYLSYKRVVRLLTEVYKVSLEQFSSEMLNNFAVACYELGKLTEAKEYYDWSLRNKSSSEQVLTSSTGSSAAIPADKLTTHYNLALWHASSGDAASALRKMETILEAYPNYSDAALYAARVYAKSGQTKESKKLLQKAEHSMQSVLSNPSAAVAPAPTHSFGCSPLESLITAQCQTGTWHLARGELDDAKHVFDAILTKSSGVAIGGVAGSSTSGATAAAAGALKKDEYAKLSLGNIALAKLLRKLRTILLAHAGFPLDHPVIQAKLREQKIDFKEVAAFYENVLRNAPNNKYAAHGLGCILANQGRFHEAKEIFIQIKDLQHVAGTTTATSNGKDSPSSAAATAVGTDESDDFLDVWLNLGHIYVLQGSYIPGIKMYQHVLTRLSAHQASPISSNISITRVQVLTYLARAYYLSDAFMEAKKTLLQAIHLSPVSTPLWYNLGLVSEAFAIDIFQKPPNFRTFSQVESAIVELNSAFAIFTRLQTTPSTPEEKLVFGDIGDKAGRHAVFCRMSITNGQPHLAYARQRENEQARLLAESREAKSKLEAEAEEKRRLAEAAAEAERQRLEAEALAKKKYLEEISTTWETVRSEENIKKDKSMSMSGGGGGDDEYTGLDAEGEVARRREKVKNRSSSSASSGSSSKRSKREHASEDEEDEDAHERKKRRKEEKRKKSGSGRSKYQTAEGSDAEPDHARATVKSESSRASPDSEQEFDVDSELAARRSKATHLSQLVAGGDGMETVEKSTKRRLTKVNASESEEENDDGENQRQTGEMDEGDTDMADVDTAASSAGGDGGGGGDDDDDDDGLTATKKKSNKKRRQIDEDEDDGEEAELQLEPATSSQQQQEEAVTTTSQDNTTMEE